MCVGSPGGIVTIRGGIGSPAIAALLGIAAVFLAASCGPSISSATVPTPSVAPSPTPSASPSQPPPPGGPLPASLLGNWFLKPAAADAILGASNPCPSPLSAATCLIQLTFTASTYRLTGQASDGGKGDVVVNGTEIDFFNMAFCFDAPGFAGQVSRYRWTLIAGVLHLTPLN
jgi:hypothetical protein